MARQVDVEFLDTLNRFADVMRVRMTRNRKWVVDFVVQYEALIDDVFFAVVRHDGSHGVPHRDLLDWSGETIDKRWASAGTTMNAALTDAMHDSRSNWEYYREDFFRRRP